MRLGGRSHPSGYGHSSGVAAHLAITTAVAISLGALVFLLPSQFGAVKGFAFGAWTAFVITSAYNWCMIASGASQSMMGEQGEVWTDGELRSLRKRGWRVVNHLTLKHGDIDHVAIGPGGLMVIESKWNSSPLALDGTDRWVGNWADQARRNTDDVKRFIGWGARADAPISPLLVVWGPHVRPTTDEFHRRQRRHHRCRQAATSGPRRPRRRAHGSRRN